MGAELSDLNIIPIDIGLGYCRYPFFMMKISLLSPQIHMWIHIIWKNVGNHYSLSRPPYCTYIVRVTWSIVWLLFCEFIKNLLCPLYYPQNKDTEGQFRRKVYLLGRMDGVCCYSPIIQTAILLWGLMPLMPWVHALWRTSGGEHVATECLMISDNDIVIVGLTTPVIPNPTIQS